MKITKKPAKKCKTLKKEAAQKKEYLQYRCNMIGFAEAMKVYNPMLQLRQDVRNELAKTPFWSILKTYMDGTLITSERKRKSDMDLIKIINCYNPATQKFKFGRHKAHGISSNDVAQIFGLNNEGIDLPNTDKSTKFGDDDRLIKKYFADVKVVKKKHLAEAYEKALEDETPEGTQDLASLICAHLVQSLLFTNSGTYITWSFLKICTNLLQINKYNWAKGQIKKKEEGEEPTTSGCTVLVLYWICLHTNLVETIEGRENMIPAITRWDTSMIHKAIKDIPVEKIKAGFEIHSAQPLGQSSRAKRHKMRAKKCKTTDAKIDNVQSENEEEQNMKNITWHDQNVNKHTEQTDEPDNISINEAQTEFDKLFADEMIKLDATVQKHIIGMDTVLSEELFDEFKKASSIAEKRYITFREMMAHAMDASNRECLILSQTINMLNSEVEKLLRKVEINKKSSSALHTEMLKMQTKTNVNNLKINIYLKQIESLEKKLQETQSKVAEMEPMSNVGEMVGEMEVERTPTAAPIIPIVEHVKNDVNEGKQSVTETKEKTRTLVRNVRARNDRKQNLDPGFEYGHPKKKQKNIKYNKFVVSDSESPLVMQSQEQTLDPVNEKENEEDNPKDESTLKIKVEAAQVQATKGELPPKACLKSNLKAKKKETMKMTKGDTKSKCPSSTWAYKLLDQEIKEKIKDYYRQCKL
ncbi:unnamed protein product [Malus baccata var. baccata]